VTNKHQKALPPSKDKGMWETEPDGRDSLPQSFSWELEAGAPFDALMDILSQRLQEGEEMVWLLSNLSQHDKLTPKVDSSGAMVETPPDSESRQAYVAVRHILRELDQLFDGLPYYKGVSGKAYQRTTAIHCALTHTGLRYLEDMLIGRRSLQHAISDALDRGRSPIRVSPYEWEYFHLIPTKQRNIWCYDRQDYARLERIATDYGWTLGNTIQMAMVVGIHHSEKLPKPYRDLAAKEVENFKMWVGKFNLVV